ncbi:SMEK domain-containing protein [Flavobacterium sp. KS-LB2]|uniref:SMEK domain-containing protein n=1 Tax=Flavobacterium sp. KS-LB2 TaxID=3120525 RepID=UPI0030CE5A19
MPKQQEEIREINSYIMAWILEIDVSTALNYTDINKVSEGICLKLLNLVYGYELKNLGKEQNNFPAVDLGESGSSKIAFQITSDTTITKIRESLEKFKQHGLDKRFTGGIKFLILRGRKKRKTVISGHEDIFEMERDVLYLSDLIKEIAFVYLEDPSRFFEIKEFLKFEFGKSNVRETSIIFTEDHNKVKNYLEVIEKFYATEVNKLVHFDLDKQNSQICTNVLFEELFDEKGAVIIGESGCGKSFMAIAWAMSLCSKGVLPVVLKLNYSDLSLSCLIEQEVWKYGFVCVLSFIKACQSTNKKILLVLDGLNECPLEVSERLISELKEFSSKYKILFIVTTQQLTESLVALGSVTIKVYRPDSELKAAIASKYSNSANKLKPILDMVSTSMEAKMVGEIGIFGVDRISRYSLFELYVRRKLMDMDKDGIYLLSAIARKMSQEISFSISLRQVDTILMDSKMETYVLERCLSTKILVKDFARISFGHEMLLNFFTAEGIARFNEDSFAVIEEFNAPKNDEKRLLVLGSIEDNVLKEKILESIGDTDLLLLLLEGEAGEFCRFWAAEKLKEILLKMRKEIDSIEFVIEAEQHPQVMIKKGSIPEWRNDELAFVEIIIYQIFSGKLLEEMFSIAWEMDTCLERIFTIMKSEARDKKISLRNGLFQSIYSPLNGKSITVSGMSYFFSCLESGFMSFKSENKIASDAIAQLAQRSNVKTGQFYLLLHLCRFNERAQALFNIISHCLSNQWEYLPRTLKFEILEVVPHCHSTDRQREELIEAIVKVRSKATLIDPWLSTNLFETLTALGALKSDAESYEQTVLSEMHEILADPDCEKSWKQASFMFNAQFDHPYSSAFYNVIDSLDQTDQKAFYAMAIKNEEEFDLFLSLLILSAEKLLGAQCCPDLLKILNKPILEATMSQERMKNHIVVCIILVKYKYDFVSLIETRKDEGEKLLVSLAEVLYWINRKDLEKKYIMEKCAPALSILFDRSSPYLIDSMKVFNNALSQVSLREYFNEDTITVESVFGDRILSACRSCLKSKDVLSIFKYEHDSTNIYRYAIDQIGSYGNINDLIALKVMADDILLGRNAIKAIKNIEEKSAR